MSARPAFQLLLGVLALSACDVGPTPDLIVSHVNVVDVVSGELLEDRNVEVLDGRILAVLPGRDQSPSERTEVLDGNDRYLIPGLWDMHVHLVGGPTAEIFAPVMVANGVLGARDTHMVLTDAVALKAAIRDGATVGPRLWVAGELVDGPQAFQPNSRKVTSAAEARLAVRDLKQGGADFVKVYSSLTREQYLAIADEARIQAMTFAGHVPFSVTAMEASESGQRTFEHLIGADVGTSSEATAILAQQAALMAAGEFWWGDGPRLEATFDSVQAAKLFAAFVRNETWQVPTLVVLRQIASTVDGADKTAPGMEYIPEEWRTIWEAPLGRFASDVKALYPFSKELVGRMHRAGVPILAGTDFPNPYTYPGFSLHDELELLVDAGLEPIAALRAATLDPARFFQATDSLGSISVGNVADMVILDGNPLEDIGLTRSIRAVIQGGRAMDRATLDTMLDQARILAEQAPPSGIW